MRAPAKTFVRARRLRREMTLPEVKLNAADVLDKKRREDVVATIAAAIEG